MPGFIEEEVAPAPIPASPEYSVLKQRVDLDVDFAHQSLKGSTEITVQPLVKDLRQIRLHCRQCKPTLIQFGGITARWEYEDPYQRLRMPANSTVYQYGMLKRKIASSLGHAPEPELVIALPSKLKIQELQVDPFTNQPQQNGTPSLQKQESDAMAMVETPGTQLALGPQFAPIKVYIEFEVSDFKDGIHWIGCEDGDKRYPHMYTKSELAPGNASCIFPCVDDTNSRCNWEISIRCPRTLGDAYRKPKELVEQVKEQPNGHSQPDGPVDAAMLHGIEALQKAVKPVQAQDKYLIDLGDEDAALELAILCVGEMVDDTVDSEDDTRHTVLFALGPSVTARHLAFAIGPFENVDLAAFREADDEEKLGQSAVKIDGYCLPGRAEELRNTAYPVHMAIDFFGVNYGSFPFSKFQLLFVDDLVHDTVPAAGMTICSTRLLFPEEVLEPLNRNTKTIIRAVADQWMGVNIIPRESTDNWVVAGIAGFMTDLFNKKLFGNNEYRWAQKMAAEKVYDLDVERPSLHQLGLLLHIDPSIRDFVNLKSALVLFILDRRLMKASSSTGVTRIINKVFLNAKTGSLTNGELSTNDFQRTCERLGHNKLDPFFRQWVFGAGCPIFEVKQRFNKKKLVVEMTITQRQMERTTKPPFEPGNFMQEIKEYVQEVWAPEVQPVFTGPMTIRIHEADGTPYEHIVEIKEQVTKLEIPYNTKYKRLKRSRRQKERAMAAGNADGTGDGGEDALLYCLGDILDSPQEVEEWRLKDWTTEEEEKMGQESYEWIRMDADFEWIGRIHLWLPLYMYVSQLQQDRDLAAQYESVKYIESCGPNHVSLSVLVRTLMDTRYFHGIRTMAADAIAALSRDKLQDVGQFHLEKAFSEMFCFEGSIMPRPNDWSNRINFLLQRAIPTAMANVRDSDGKVPMSVRRFFVDKLKFNDNSNNEFSDAHYIATLMTCLADSLVASHHEAQPSYTFSFGEDEPMETDNPDADFETEAVNEIERYRRIDEWISTYHNVYSITALESLRKLTKAGVVKDKTRELLVYTRQGNADNVRLEAFRCLVEIGMARKMSMMGYLLHSLSDDLSPYFRDRLLKIFGEALGHIALGNSEPEQAVAAAPVDADSGLVLEQEVSNEVRHMEMMRKTTPEGALLALKTALEREQSYQNALWYAITSPVVTINEVGALIDTAALVFEAKISYNVTLKLPRMYHIQRLGKGKLRFYQNGPYRTTPSKGLALEDWQAVQDFGLKYEGKLSMEVQRRKSSVEESLKQQIAHLKQQQTQTFAQHSTTQQAAPQQSMMPPPSSLPTPSSEKPGFKIKLGEKRKQSASAAPRDGSPKAQKVSKQQTPNGHAHSPAPPRASPGLPGPTKARRSSIPGSNASAKKAGRSKTVVLKFSRLAGKVKEILSRPPAPKRKASSQPSSVPQTQARTPSIPQPSSIFPGSTLLQSPISPSMSSFAASPAPAPALNMGAFRSYGPATDVSAAAPKIKQEKPETKKLSLKGIPSNTGPSAQKSGTNSPVNGAHPVGPPKKKLTLKLGRKTSEQ